MHCNADYYWWKSFGKDCNHYEEGRSLYQVLLNVYDWTKYWDRDPMLRKCNKCASITATVSVSRTIDEPSISLNWDLKNSEFVLKDMEDKAFEFYFELIEALYADRKELDVDYIQVSYGLIHIPTLKETARKRIKEYEPDEE